MNRRSFLQAVSAAGVSAGLRARWSESHAAPQAGTRTSMGVCVYSFSRNSKTKSTFDFLEYCHSLGAGGVQVELSSLDPAYLKQLRTRSAQLGMYLEIITSLPEQDATPFERTVMAAKEAGAVCLRTACLSGRRYETFSSLDAWKQFVADSRARISLAVPIVEKHRLPMGIENHKDWTTDEMVALMERYSSEFLGVCLDTGNNVSLLDDPMDVVDRLAPYAVSTHVKDMATEEYAEGFLLSEVPLGGGMLDMKRIVQTIAKSRPRTNICLEMITRNPLKIPCLTDQYWVTFPDRSGGVLARALTMIRAHKPGAPLPRPEGLDDPSRARLEEENVKKCLAYARNSLGLEKA